MAATQALLKARTLVLDAGYNAASVIPWERAFKLYFEGECEILENYEDPTFHVHTVTMTYPCPAVVRLRKGGVRKRVVKFSRANIWMRDKGRCQYCGTSVRMHDYTYDHVHPRSKDGHTNWTNVVAACYSCNKRKANRTPEQAGMRLLSVPVRPKSLPGVFTVAFRKGHPPEWKKWMKDDAYWNGLLESD